MIETAEYMSQPVIHVDTSASIMELVTLMDKHNIGSIVITSDDKIQGIVTERDIIRKVLSTGQEIESTQAQDIMTEEVHTVHQDASVMEISAKMKEHIMRRIVVVDDQEKPLGIITSRDLIGLLV